MPQTKIKMKKYFLFFAAATLMAACGDSKTTSTEAGEVAEATETAITYTIDPAASTVAWFGKKVISGNHNGTVNITSGNLAFENNELAAGSFVIDMNTITDLDLPADSKENKDLTAHLKSGDFFMVDSFPTATFEITSVAAATDGASTHTINGNLTIKGISKGISFPANITTSETGVQATAKLKLTEMSGM